MAADSCRLETAAQLLVRRARLFSCACVVEGRSPCQAVIKEQRNAERLSCAQDLRAVGCIAAVGSFRLDQVGEAWPG